MNKILELQALIKNIDSSIEDVSLMLKSTNNDIKNCEDQIKTSNEILSIFSEVNVKEEIKETKAMVTGINNMSNSYKSIKDELQFKLKDLKKDKEQAKLLLSRIS